MEKNETVNSELFQERVVSLLEEILATQNSILSSMKEFCDKEELCEMLNLKMPTINKMIQDGILTGYKPFGKKLYFKKDEVLDYIFRKEAERKVQTAKRKK